MPESVKILLYAVLIALCLIGTYILFRKKQKPNVEIHGTTIELSSEHRKFIQDAPSKFLSEFSKTLEDTNVTIHSSGSDLCVLYEDDPDHETDILITLSLNVSFPSSEKVEEIKVLCHYLGHIEVLHVKNSSKIASFNEQEIKKSLYLLGLIENANE